MNNKKLGMAFEKEVVKILSANGYWAHFISPDARGAQPFDIIAVRDDEAVAVECKTLADNKKYFTFDRLEDNQIMAFRKWRECGNNRILIAIKHKNGIKFYPYESLEEHGRILCE